jgi:8-oxo-dGTP pyrophosphatase MutT (NUDIX family)
MSQAMRVSRGGFVVIKLLVDGEICLLLRKNPKWKDLNLIGGHEKTRDGESLAKTALRELWEEVPSVRKNTSFSLRELTDELEYGPVVSRSVGEETLYLIQYFLFQLDDEPTFLLENLGARTRNVLVSESDLLGDQSGRISGLVWFLDRIYLGGLKSIPLSSPINIHSAGQRLRGSLAQLEFALF